MSYKLFKRLGIGLSLIAALTLWLISHFRPETKAGTMSWGAFEKELETLHNSGKIQESTFRRLVDSSYVIKLDDTSRFQAVEELKSSFIAAQAESLRIVTNIGDNPWQVAIVDQIRKKVTCGGTIVGKRWVLTAAHCFDGVELYFVSIVAGHALVDPKYFQNYNPIRIADTFKINYDPKASKNDIALVELSRDLIFTDGVQPLSIPDATWFSANISPGQILEISGWGWSNVWDPPHFLRATDVNYQKVDVCDASDAVFFDENKIVTKTVQAGFDNGDSGGPLVFRDSLTQTFFLVGVINHSQGSPLSGTCAFYANTYKFRDWVNSGCGGCLDKPGV